MLSGVAANTINCIVLLAAYPIYLHFLGYEEYGVWLVLATVLSFAQLGDIGISQAVVKLVAEEYGQRNFKRIEQYVATALLILVASGVAMLMIIVPLRRQIVDLFRLSGENAQLAIWLLPFVACLSVYALIVQTIRATLSGLGRMDLVHWMHSAARILAVAIATTLLYTGHGIESLLIGNFFSYVAMHIIAVICIRRIASLSLLRIADANWQRSKRLIAFGSAVFGGSLINMLLSPFNKLMLSRYAGVSSVPIYEIAYNGSMQVRRLIEAGLRALMPEISRISGNVRERTAQRIAHIYSRAMRVVVLAGAPVYAMAILLATPFLRYWLKQKYLSELPFVLRMMLLATFISLLGVPAYNTLLGAGQVRHILAAHAIVAGVNAIIVLAMVFVCHSVSVEKISWAILIASTAATQYLRRQNSRMSII